MLEIVEIKVDKFLLEMMEDAVKELIKVKAELVECLENDECSLLECEEILKKQSDLNRDVANWCDVFLNDIEKKEKEK